MAAEPAKSRWADLGLRVATGLVLFVGIVLLILLAPLAALAGLVALVATLGMGELLRMTTAGRWGLAEFAALGLAAALPLCALLGGAGLAAGLLVALLASSIVAVLAGDDLDLAWDKMTRRFWDVAYCGGLLACVLPLAALPGGRVLVIFCIISVAAADVGAYFAGHQFGRRKLAPRISPGKTIEGLIGGALLSFAVGAAFAALWVADTIWWLGGLVGLVLGLASVGGDLLESSLKRQAGVKDSSGLLPGHGGVLDRIDGHVTAFPLFLLIRVIWW